MMFISVVYFMTLDQFYFSRYRMNLRLISCRMNELYLKYFSLYALCYKGLCITQSSHKVSITNKEMIKAGNYCVACFFFALLSVCVV